MNQSISYEQASIQTAQDLKTVATRPDISSLSHLSLPEIEVISELVARYVPAGNVPGVILSGLVRLPGRKVPNDIVQRDLRLLFRGVEQTADRALYATLFAGPAAVLWGYQNLLKLAGKPPDSAFPEGHWQFYVDYALREDTARHANETRGFENALQQHNLNLSPADRLTAWVMACIHILHQYNALLENEWRERVYSAVLEDVTRQRPDAEEYASLYRTWQKQIPYRRGQDAGNRTYPQYRQGIFDQFLQPYLEHLSSNLRLQWHQAVQEAEAQDMPAYQHQMSILAYLRPDTYSELRVPLPIEQTNIGIIYKGNYFLIPVCTPNTSLPADINIVRPQISSLMRSRLNPMPTSLQTLSRVRRSTQVGLRTAFTPELTASLEQLHTAPIIINTGTASPYRPLAQQRQVERGCGDHPLTLIDTGSSFIFDQSHIFFDGSWGAALAEIITNEALSWAVYLYSNRPNSSGIVQVTPLNFNFQPSDQAAVQAAPKVPVEASAENENLNLSVINNLRQLLKKRSQELQLTVNDFLVLYRAIHSFTYQPSVEVLTDLQALVYAGSPQAKQAAAAALEAIQGEASIAPALLIPVAADNRRPSERLIPLSFEVPLVELDLLNLHRQTVQALDIYQSLSGDRSSAYDDFFELQRTYLATLSGFGEVIRRAKQIAWHGESASVGVIRLLAHLPIPVQRLLDKIPAHFDMLNDLIKGREVFSNIGQVAPTSTLTRFISAKDDNEKKTLIWGIMTDNRNTVHISLRDFRPHVQMLYNIGSPDLAHRLTQDYLDTYVNGMNRYINDLRRITLGSRSSQQSTKSRVVV